MMIKALLALALTVNLATSITCYNGQQTIYSGCGTASTNTIVSTDGDTISTAYDTCMSYTYSGTGSGGCSYDQVVSTFTSSALINTAGMDCDYYEALADASATGGGMTMTDWTCTTCTTDDCNSDATEVVASESGAGSLYASRTLACLSSFAVALLLCRL